MTMWNCEIILNIACDIISAVIIAVITSVGSFLINRQKNKKYYNLIVGELKSKCRDILYKAVSCAELRCGSNDEKHTFSEWMGLIFDEKYTEDELSYSEHEDICLEFIVGILLVEEKTTQLINISKYFLENPNFKNAFISDLRSLKSICFSIKTDFDNNRFSACEEKLSKRFTKCVVNLFPELEESFEKRYNINDLEDTI